MTQLFDKRYRILEEKDANGTVIFYPEQKANFFKGKWTRFTNFMAGSDALHHYNTYKEANEWLCSAIYDDNKQVIVKKTSHKFSPTFAKLTHTDNDSTKEKLAEPRW